MKVTGKHARTYIGKTFHFPANISGFWLFFRIAFALKSQDEAAETETRNVFLKSIIFQVTVMFGMKNGGVTTKREWPFFSFL